MKSGLKLDWQLILPSLILIFLSLTVLYSIKVQLALSQFLFMAVSLPFFFIFASFDYQKHYYLYKIYAVFSFLLLLLPFIFGVVSRGSMRWVQLGNYTLQPSEIIKPFLIIILASFLIEFKKQKPLIVLIAYSFLLFLPVILVFKQPDLGSSLVILFAGLMTLFFSSLPLMCLLLFPLAFLISLPILKNFLKDYQKQRIFSFLNPFSDPQGTGYHIIQSLIAIGSGGLWGRGLGRGLQSQLQFLPERQTDFIFAGIAEELGLWGSAILIFAYFFILLKAFLIAKNSSDDYGRLMAMGIFGLLFCQGFINLAMNLGLLPITGVTLPLVSAGGSSLLASLIILGILNNISIHQKIRPTVEIK